MLFALNSPIVCSAVFGSVDASAEATDGTEGWAGVGVGGVGFNALLMAFVPTSIADDTPPLAAPVATSWPVNPAVVPALAAFPAI